MTPIQKAIHSIGGQERVASLFHVSQQAVSLWSTQGHAPMMKAKALSEVSGVDWRELISPEIKALMEE